MANITFQTAIDFSTLDPTDWFDVTATNTSSTSMDFIDGGQSINVQGTGFNYFMGVPISGTANSIFAEGDINGSITGLNVAISDVAANRNDSEALLDLFFGGNDNVKGSSGADVLYGFGGKDTIKGNKGNDTINGGEGTDKLSGGKGSDTFVLNLTSDTSKKHPDRITDLDDAKDHIDLSNMEIQGAVSAAYDEGKDLTTFAIDTDGNGKADAWIVADGNHTGFDNFLI